MPRLPDKSQLPSAGSLRSGRAYPSAKEADLSAAGQGLEALGRGVGAVAARLDTEAEKGKNEDNALDLIRADQAQKQALFDTERSLESDGDYPTHDRRYTEAANAASDTAAGLIRDPKLREKWRLKADNDVIAGRGRVTNRADTFVRQQRGVQLEETLDKYRKDYTDPMTTDDQRGALTKSMEDSIELGKRSGVLNPVQAQKLREQYVIGAVKQDAERRLIDEPASLRRDILQDAAPQGELEPGNIDLNKRPIVRNQDGSVSTIKSMSFEEDGRQILVPTLAPDGKEMTKDEAIKRYHDTGEHLGVFQRPEQATAWARRLSERQGRAFLPNKGMGPEAISTRLETGKTDPLQGVNNISSDSNGSKSYGNFGLNSQRGASAWQFAREYGAQLGLRGNPGSEEFDRSWKALAANDPQGLHQAEMAWYQKNILVPTSEELRNAGVSEQLASDPRVIAYFADRKIQQGSASIDGVAKHEQRIGTVAAAAGGDPVKFLKGMTEADRSALTQDFPSALRSGVYSERGHDARLNGRLKMALAMGDEDSGYPQASGRYAALSPLERTELLNKAERANRQQFEGHREQLKQQLADDVESMRKTGTAAPVDLEMARRVLEPNQINRYFLNREEARMEYEATNDLPGLDNGQLVQRLDSIAPKPGEAFYAAKAKVYGKAKKIADDILQKRDTDPAASVESLPEVKQAAAAAAGNPEDPGAIQNLARARVDAQARVGIPDSRRSPITKAEARIIVAPTRGLEGKALTESMLGVTQKLDQQYGPYARAAGVAAVEMMVHNRELAETIEGQINNAFRGLPITAASQRRVEYLTESAQATKAFGGDFVGEASRQLGPDTRDFSFKGQNLGEGAPEIPLVEDPFQAYGPRPSPGAIAYLRENPNTADAFNAKYGNGTAANFLAQPAENFGVTVAPPPAAPAAPAPKQVAPTPPPLDAIPDQQGETVYRNDPHNLIRRALGFDPIP